jgi:type 1 fimbria pilin
MRLQRLVTGCSILLLVIVAASAAAYAAESVTVTGEVIDTYCYSMAGAKGEAHRQCALECAKKGIPVGLVEDGTNKVYVLLPSKNASPLPQSVIDNMARKVTITGKVVESGGSRFLTVESIKS